MFQSEGTHQQRSGVFPHRVYVPDLPFKASFMDDMPTWTLDQIAGLAFGVRFPFPYPLHH